MNYGTVLYMAPEIISGKLLEGPEYDNWALGVLLYEFLEGWLPFYDDDDEKTKKKILEGKFKFERYLQFFFRQNLMIIIIILLFHAFSLQHISDPPVSEECKNLIGRMLAKDLKTRPSLEEIMKDDWINIGFEKEKLKPHTESELNMIDESLIGKSDTVFIFSIK